MCYLSQISVTFIVNLHMRVYVHMGFYRGPAIFSQLTFMSTAPGVQVLSASGFAGSFDVKQLFLHHLAYLTPTRTLACSLKVTSSKKSSLISPRQTEFTPLCASFLATLAFIIVA